MNSPKLPETHRDLTLLERREIEASIIGPILKAFMRKFGTEACLETLREVISDLARAQGKEMAKILGDMSLEAFAQTLGNWKAGHALEIEILEQNDEKLEFNVTRCRYAEMYQRLGLQELGSTLSCLRDFELVKGFNPDLELQRNQTIMEGASHCDFRFSKKPD